MNIAGPTFTMPANPFPLLPLRNGVLLPGTLITLPMGRRQSVELVKSMESGAVLGVGVQRDPRLLDPALGDLLPLGTVAKVHQVFRTPSQGLRLVLEGLGRFHLDALVQSNPYWMAVGHTVTELGHQDPAVRLLAQTLQEALQGLAPLLGGALDQFLHAVAEVEDPGLVADRTAAALNLDQDKESQVLLSLDVAERLRLVIRFIAEARALAEVKNKIESDVRQEVGKGHREALLREQLKAIRRELGDDPAKEELGLLRRRLDEAGLPEEARAVADRELARLDQMNPAQAEHNIIRTYLEWLTQLPWSKRVIPNDDVAAVEAKLDQDHAGLQEVKQRILQHLAVLKVTGNRRGTILCLAGPPGVGKTSLGQSIADATGRPFVRVALGGVRDEAEVRGHRRTYVGALPGRILHALRKAGVKNPVFLLDEIDKLGTSWHGSPEAALLEVLDPEQNRTFQDHYLELPFDLSEVLFICTANTLETLSPPLRDRLEVVELSGYTTDEKLHIARHYLIPRALSEHGLPSGMLTISDGALKAILAGHTREAGVRQLSRELARLCRSLTLERARHPERPPVPVEVDAADVDQHLGRPRFHCEVAERTAVPGVATGLAWTAAGGDILFVETSRMPGKGRLEITGQLGDVMKESARAALTYVRSNAQELGVDPGFLETQDLHLHIPAGGVPKDGPSAGVTIFTALTSLLTGRRVRPDTAMTGECSLRGRVLPVGGIKEKVVAAHRAGLTRVVLPRKNERDLEDLPAETRAALEFILVQDMTEVLDAALEPAAPAFLPRRLDDGAVRHQPTLTGVPAGGLPHGLLDDWGTNQSG